METCFDSIKCREVNDTATDSYINENDRKRKKKDRQHEKKERRNQMNRNEQKGGMTAHLLSAIYSRMIHKYEKRFL